MNNKQVLELFSDAEINTRRLQELSNLLVHLKKIKIEPLLLKGAGLIKTVYPHPALRVMGDIDLLIKPDEFNSARKLLISENYQSVSRDIGHFLKSTSFKMLIDLHWDIWYLKKDEFENLWKESLSFSLNDASPPDQMFCQAGAKTLAAEEHFIYIAVHSILHHGILDMVRLQDLTMLINHTTNFNWSLLVKKIKGYQLETLLSIVLERLQEIQPEIIPASVFTQLRHKGLNRFLSKLMKQVISRSAIPNIGNILKINAVRGFRGKVRYFLSYLFPSELFIKEKYPLISKYPLLLYCYYLHRPIYLTCQGIRLLSRNLT
ncbi:MAG: nucleotidyltransferase family protein [Planctomycetota bacterium]